MPVFTCHSVAVNAETAEAIGAADARRLFERFPGLRVWDDPAEQRYPMPVVVEGQDDCYVGRIREDLSHPRAINFWVVGDQLRKGAATNAVQIAELLLRPSGAGGARSATRKPGRSERGGGRSPRTFRLVVAYDGTAYCGWQTQPERPPSRGSSLVLPGRLDPNARLTGASRTDAGVHALGQVASLDHHHHLVPDRVGRALNATIPADIRVLSAAEARPGFDARREATCKRYVYLVDCQAVAHPFLRRFAWHVPQRLDVDAMRQAIATLRGCHDFSAFCAAPGRGALPVCTIRDHSRGAAARPALVRRLG